MATHEAGYAPQLESLRSSAKWLIAGSASIGLVLVGGLQLTALDELSLSSWRPYAALVAILATLSSVAYVIKLASAVLTHEWLNLVSFTSEAMNLPRKRGSSPIPADQLTLIEQALESARHEMFGHVATSVADLHRRLQETNGRLPDLADEERRAAMEQSAELRRTASAVAEYANYHATLFLFNRMRRRLILAGAVATASALLFALAVKQPSPGRPIDVRVVSSRQAPEAFVPGPASCPQEDNPI
jgi:hypothetical protein